jgi:hypothetical protein
MQLSARTTQPEKSGPSTFHRPTRKIGQPTRGAGADQLHASASSRDTSALSRDFSRISIPSAPTFVAQKKLVVGSVGDPLEREADAVADRVMAMSDPSFGQPGGPEPQHSAAHLHRKCRSCAAEAEDEVPLRRSSLNPSHTTMSSPPIVHTVLRRHGSPLETPARQFMETRFNRDFSHVRVHADAMAAESARQLNARAYTVGSNIVFGDGQYSPGTLAGRHLLAHELAHTVQQASSGSGLVQRAEVDDSRSQCKGLKDIGAEVNSEVNAKIATARAQAPEGFEQDDNKLHKFLLAVRNQLLDIENWIHWHKEANQPSSHSGTKYQGTAGLSTSPGDLAAVVNVGGTCVGADKLGHFFVDGWNAYKSKDDASAIMESYDAEITNQGLGATGVFSNADIVANLAGRKFYQSLKKNTQMKFDIGGFISNKWNEASNPNYYSQATGEVVWKNLLESDWTGIVRFPGYEKDLEVKFNKVDMTDSTLEGDYQEQVKQDGSDPWNQTLIMGGSFWGEFKLHTHEVAGASEKASAIYGVSMTIDLDMDGGPDRTGSFASEGERVLNGNWSEDESGDPDEKGSWGLKRR